MARTIGSITIDDNVNSFIHEVIPNIGRSVQTEQLDNRYGRVTRVKEDYRPTTIDIRGTWRDSSTKHFGDFKAAMLSQQQVNFTLGDGTRWEMVDVVEMTQSQIASAGAGTANPDQAFGYVLRLQSYEAFVREVSPSLQQLGPLAVGNQLTANDASFETSVAGWSGAAVNCAKAQTAAQALNGTKSMSLTSSAGGTMSVSTPAGVSGYVCTAGTTYTALASFRTAVSARSCNIGINWYKSDGTSISTTTGGNVSDSSGGWTQATVTGAAPALAAFARVIVQVLSTGGASEVHYVDCVSFAQGTSTTWALAPGTYTTNVSVNCVGSAFSEPTWQLQLVVPSGTTVSQLKVQNTTSGEICTVSPTGVTNGTFYLLMDASGGNVPSVGTIPTPNNNAYSLLATNSLGYGCTLYPNGGAAVDQDFTGNVPTLVQSATPSIPVSTNANNIIVSVSMTGGPLTNAAAAVLAPARYYR